MREAGPERGVSPPAGPAAGLTFWSQTSLPGRPSVISIDATQDTHGWESEAAARVTNSLVRRDIRVVSGGVIVANGLEEVVSSLRPPGGYNCILIFAGTEGEVPAASLWSELKARLGGQQKLFALCTWDGADGRVSEDVLKGRDHFGVMGVAQQTPLSGRAAGLFFMKFFAELDLHSHATESMTGKMVWFAHSKAREILRRRHLDGRIGLRS